MECCYCANNPTLFASADAVLAVMAAHSDLRVVSIGVGVYPEPKPSLKMWFAKKYLVSVQLLQKTLEINTQSMDQLREVLFREVPTIRISDTFERPEMATDLMEHDLADRKSVVSGKRVSVRVYLGGRRNIKKKKNTN